MCADLQRVLKVDELTDVELRIAAKFRHYKWERRVKDRRSFKRALAKYQESHPDVDIIAENISRWRPLVQYFGYLLSGIVLLVRLISYGGNVSPNP